MAGLQGIKISAYLQSGTGDDEKWSYVTQVTTATDGSYQIAGLNSGSYRLKFNDPEGAYLTEYYNNKSTLDQASNIAVSSATTVSGIDVVLGLASYIEGSIADS